MGFWRGTPTPAGAERAGCLQEKHPVPDVCVPELGIHTRLPSLSYPIKQGQGQITKGSCDHVSSPCYAAPHPGTQFPQQQQHPSVGCE